MKHTYTFVCLLLSTLSLQASEAVRMQQRLDIQRLRQCARLTQASYGRAVQTNNTQYLKDLIHQGIPLGKEAANQLLIDAAAAGHCAVAEVLLKKCRADINCQQGAALKKAVFADINNAEAMMKFLLTYGARAVVKASPIPENVWQLDEQQRRAYAPSLEEEFNLLLQTHNNDLEKVVETLTKTKVSYLIPRLLTHTGLQYHIITPLLITACKEGNHQCVEELLDCGVPAHIQETTPERYSPLMHAVENGHTEVVRLLVTHPRLASWRQHLLEQRNNAGETPLIMACSRTHVNLEIAVRNKTEKWEQAATRLAASREIATMLLNAGADIDDVDDKGCSAFMHALFSLHMPMIELLRNHPRHKEKDLVNALNLHGYVPTMVAIMEGDMDAFELLIDELKVTVHDASVTDFDGNTLYMLAASYGQTAIMQKIVRVLTSEAQTQARLDEVREICSRLQCCTNQKGQDALHLACIGGHVAAVNAYFDHFLMGRRLHYYFEMDQINRYDNEGFTPLGRAAYDGHTAVIEALIGRLFMLLDYSANREQLNMVNAPYDYGNRLRLSNNLNWQYHRISNAKPEHRRNTPLHFAALQGHTDAAAMLLRYQADKNLKNEAGQTPAEVAKAAGHDELAAFLERA